VLDPKTLRAPRSPIDAWTPAPPQLENTLIRGYTRLATDAAHRRIDAELRTLDLLLASVFGLIALPFALLIALVVLLSSGRPVLYRGERVGRRGHFFQMLKFRTMR